MFVHTGYTYKLNLKTILYRYTTALLIYIYINNYICIFIYIKGNRSYVNVWFYIQFWRMHIYIYKYLQNITF